MRIFKYMKSVCFILVLVLVNFLLSFMIEPEGGASKRMWAGYYSEKELDTIFVGSSLCQQTFIPEIFNKEMGIKSYNMGTPSQAIPQTRRAIEVAVKEHGIKTVIFGMNFSSLKYDPIPEAEMTFESARVRQKGGLAGVVDALSYMYSEGVCDEENSINFLFPWLYNYENYSLDKVKENVTEKIEEIKVELETGVRDETDGLLKGFRNDDTSIFNYDNKWVKNSYLSYEAYFSSEMLQEFEEMLMYCQQEGIDIIIINTPQPVFDVITCYESYEKNERRLLAICDKYNVDYYDFSLAKPELYEINAKYFCDNEHLNRQGAEDFCMKLAGILERRANGENLDEYFYSVEEFLTIHDDELQDWIQWSKGE